MVVEIGGAVNVSVRRDYTGVEIGRLRFLRWLKDDKNRNQIWECACKCGEIFATRLNSITSGRTQSCGCLQREAAIQANRTHGHASRGKHSPEYIVFYGARSRCTNPKNPAYKHYGGRGIKFLIKSIPELVSLVGKRPDPSLSLDRINNNGNYEAGNIRWATWDVQANNRRRRLADTVSPTGERKRNYA